MCKLPLGPERNNLGSEEAERGILILLVCNVKKALFLVLMVVTDKESSSERSGLNMIRSVLQPAVPCLANFNVLKTTLCHT